MSNPVLPLPITGAGAGVAKYIAAGPVGVDKRRRVSYYVKDDQLCNYLPLVCACISHLKCATKNHKHRNSCIDSGAFMYCLFTAATTLALKKKAPDGQPVVYPILYN